MNIGAPCVQNLITLQVKRAQSTVQCIVVRQCTNRRSVTRFAYVKQCRAEKKKTHLKLPQRLLRLDSIMCNSDHCDDMGTSSSRCGGISHEWRGTAHKLACIEQLSFVVDASALLAHSSSVACINWHRHRVRDVAQNENPFCCNRIAQRDAIGLISSVHWQRISVSHRTASPKRGKPIFSDLGLETITFGMHFVAMFHFLVSIIFHHFGFAHKHRCQWEIRCSGSRRSAIHKSATNFAKSELWLWSMIVYCFCFSV